MCVCVWISNQKCWNKVATSTTLKPGDCFTSEHPDRVNEEHVDHKEFDVDELNEAKSQKSWAQVMWRQLVFQNAKRKH